MEVIGVSILIFKIECTKLGSFVNHSSRFFAFSYQQAKQ